MYYKVVASLSIKRKDVVVLLGQVYEYNSSTSILYWHYVRNPAKNIGNNLFDKPLDIWVVL